MEYNGLKIWKLQVLWGKQHGVVFVPSAHRVFVEREDIIILSMPENTSEKEKNTFLKEALKDALHKKIEILMPKWENITGLRCSSWYIGKSHRAWGRCNCHLKRIMLNENLILKPEKCLEYVILHELCHLKVPNHGKNFVELLSRYMPDWREQEIISNGKVAAYGKWK